MLRGLMVWLLGLMRVDKFYKGYIGIVLKIAPRSTYG